MLWLCGAPLVLVALFLGGCWVGSAAASWPLAGSVVGLYGAVVLLGQTAGMEPRGLPISVASLLHLVALYLGDPAAVGVVLGTAWAKLSGP